MGGVLKNIALSLLWTGRNKTATNKPTIKLKKILNFLSFKTSANIVPSNRVKDDLGPFRINSFSDWNSSGICDYNFQETR